MRVTIFGASGLLGKALMREWKEDQVTGLSSKDADIRDPQQIGNAVKSTRPDWIVLRLYRCRWMRNQSRAGVRRESRWRGKCGASSEAA